jgi:hypothetical protein
MAFAVGYLAVPRRRAKIPRDVATRTDVAQVREAVEAVKGEEAKRTGLLGTAWALAAPIAIRAAQGYASQYLENWILQQHQSRMAVPEAPLSGSGGEPPGPGGTV